MLNKVYPGEELTFDDVYFTCFMIEKIARARHLQNFEVINKIPRDDLYELVSCAQVYHCMDDDVLAAEWIEKYDIPTGDFQFDNVLPEFNVTIPTDLQIGKLFAYIIIPVANNRPDGDIIQTMYDVYNSPITLKINDYNTSAFYEPDYVQIRAFYNGHF